MTKRKIIKVYKAIERSYYKQGEGVQINMLDIPKLFTDCRAQLLRNEPDGGYSPEGFDTEVDAAVLTAIARYRVN